MKTLKKLSFSLLSILFLACGGSTEKQDEKQESKKSIKADKVSKLGKQLNMTVLLDLSDRVEPSKFNASPSHAKRDIEIVNYLTEVFKKEMTDRGAFMAKGKMKVIFSPRPNDSEINEIAAKLNIDLSKAENNKEKKEIYENISADFKENLEAIYAKTIQTKKYPGSDIWRFFKNDVLDYTVKDDYRNILVLISDGYIYHENSKDKQGNRSAYLTPSLLNRMGLRTDNWRGKIEKEDFGYITTRKDLENLEVLVLEINPTKKHKNDEDIMKAYFSKWFEEMNVKSYRLYNSDLPEYTKSRIEKFIYNK